MPNYLAPEIANEFLRRRSGTSIPAQMQLQKWVFKTHGWNLAVNNAPLIREKAQAWDNGPVFRSIWDHIKDYGFGIKENLLINPHTGRPFKADLTSKELDVIDRTWKKYRDFSGEDLSRMTHEPGTPWTKAYFGRGRNAGISDTDTQNYYVKLALAGRA